MLVGKCNKMFTVIYLWTEHHLTFTGQETQKRINHVKRENWIGYDREEKEVKQVNTDRQV